MQSIKVHSVTGDVRPVNAISVWDASSTGKRPVDSIPVWDDTNEGDKPLNAIQVKLVGDEPSAIKVWFKGDEPGPGPGPVLPSYTIRLKYKEGTTPTFSKGTGTLVDEENNIWDLTYNSGNWTSLLLNHSDLLEVIGANTVDVTRMSGTFQNCTSLTTVSLFDTSNVTRADNLFNSCTSLTAIPLFDTSKISNMYQMFYNCPNVQSGALELYKQAATQTNPPSNHTSAFKNCGSNTPTGIADLAFIPVLWGGNFPGFVGEVTIGDVTWADSNVAIDDGEGGIITQELHDVNGVDLGTQYYYTYEAAQRIANKLVGWRLPTADEAHKLFQVDIMSLMSTTAWTYNNGTNQTGLNMKPVGYCNPTLENTGTYSPFWIIGYVPGAAGMAIMEHDQWSTNLIDAIYNYMPIRLVKET